MRGASVLQEILEQEPQRNVRVLVVWQSILASDFKQPGPGILGRISDSRAQQFWDPQNIFPQALQSRLSADASHARPDCCYNEDGVPWDLVAIYPAGARWDAALPAATFINGPLWRHKADIRNAVISANGK